jgi:predicted enzyme related to lactoylglutathione lyase
MKTPMPEAPEAWMPYVQVASADQTVEKAKRLGATIFLAPTDVANVGRLAVFSDPLGGWLGVLQPART